MSKDSESNDDTWFGKDLPLGNVWSENPDDLEKARMFLHFETSDADTIEEVIENIAFPLNRFKTASFDETVSSLMAIELMANETPIGVSLENIVLWDANHHVKSEEEARLWLLEFAEVIRDILRAKLKELYADLFDEDEDMPPRKYPVLVTRPRKFFYPE